MAKQRTDAATGQVQLNIQGKPWVFNLEARVDFTRRGDRMSGRRAARKRPDHCHTRLLLLPE